MTLVRPRAHPRFFVVEGFMSRFNSRFSQGRRLLAAATVVLATGLAACGEKPPAFRGTDISGTHLGKDMAMQDTAGQLRTLADYKGKVTVVFFGYTQCPDVCPTSMVTLGQAVETLGSNAGQVQVLMITVDPDRDTPEILDAYVKAFNPAFVGLRGTPQQTADTARSFKAFYAKAKGATPDQYAMDHAASYYVLDKKGEARVLISNNAPPEDIAHDLKQLM